MNTPEGLFSEPGEYCPNSRTILSFNVRSPNFRFFYFNFILCVRFVLSGVCQGREQEYELAKVNKVILLS